MEELEQWFNTQDYPRGVEIFKKYRGKCYLSELFERSQSSFTASKLYDELLKLLEELQEADRKKLIEQPESIKEKRLKSFQLMDERVELKAYLRSMYFSGGKSYEAQKQAAFRIIEIRDELDLTFEAIDFFEKKGVEIEQVQTPEMENFIQRLLNVRTYVSKYQAAVNNNTNLKGKPLTESMMIKYLQRLAGYSAELSKLEAFERLTRET